jgi:diacylglycerol O-acyltransferase
VGDWEPDPHPGRVQLAVEAAVDSTGRILGIARGAAQLALSPRRHATRVAETLRRVSAVVRDDILTIAPESAVNVQIGPRRTLVRHRADMEDIVTAKRLPLLGSETDHVTVNDVYLAAVAGALRTLALRRGEAPQPLKVMVPVNLRGEDEHDGSGGNRISFCFVELPVQVSSARARLRRVHQATVAFKRSNRSDGSNAVLNALGVLPTPLKTFAAKRAASPRTYNVTISNIPGPTSPLYMLGARLEEAYPVVPLSEDHALSVGVFGYGEHAHFGFYADPGALPDVHDLPAATAAEIRELAGPPRRQQRKLKTVANGDAAHEPTPVTPLR